MSTESAARRDRCAGLAGWLFGHKYQDLLGRVGVFCLRCGKAAEIPEGGDRDDA